MPDFDIVNVVGNLTYKQELDLEALAEIFKYREEISSVVYEPAKNHWVQTHFEPDGTYVAFYRGGRCSIAGCKSVRHLEMVAERVNKVMCDLLESGYESDVEVSNIVATADLGSDISLDALTLELGFEQTEYEPEQFPGIIYRDSQYVMIIFSSGKLLLTGLTDLDTAAEAVEIMNTRIQSVV